MKKELTMGVIALVALFLICYLSGTFIEGSLNPQAWLRNTREAVIGIWGLLFFVYVGGRVLANDHD